MRRSLLLAAIALAAAAASAAGTNPSDRKADVDAQLSRVHDKIAALQARESTLKSEIATVTTRIRALEGRVGGAQARLEPLERDLELHQERLAHLTALFELQTQRLRFLRSQYTVALARLDRRLIDLYESDESSTLSAVFSARSLSQLLDDLEFLRLVARGDKQIAQEVEQAREDALVARLATKRTRVGVASATRVISARAAQVREVRDELLTREYTVARERQRQQGVLSGLTKAEREEVAEAESLSKVSAQLAAKIRAAESSAPPSAPPSAAPSAAGLIWPVNGPITSPFGWRWGRMHEGIDIGVGYGTPIHAAAAGTVVYAGWLGGYGNLVVVDHGGSISTAYGHQSAIAVSQGQQVAQGQVLGYVGCTGHCFGPHLHFEVRINGSAVDPLGYL